MNKVMFMVILENMVTLICMTALILGLYYMGAGIWSLIPGALVLNLSSIEFKDTGKINPEDNHG